MGSGGVEEVRVRGNGLEDRVCWLRWWGVMRLGTAAVEAATEGGVSGGGGVGVLVVAMGGHLGDLGSERVEVDWKGLLPCRGSFSLQGLL